MTQSIQCYQCHGKGKILKLGNMGFKECIVCDGRGIVLAEKECYVPSKKKVKVIPATGKVDLVLRNVEDQEKSQLSDPPKKRKYTKKSESWKTKEDSLSNS